MNAVPERTNRGEWQRDRKRMVSAAPENESHADSRFTTTCLFENHIEGRYGCHRSNRHLVSVTIGGNLASAALKDRIR